MNFYELDVIDNTSGRNKKVDYVVSVDFRFGSDTDDLVCKGGGMAAFWYGDKWYTDENELMAIIDRDIYQMCQDLKKEYPDARVAPNYMRSNKTRLMKNFKEYCAIVPQSDVEFNKRILFSNVVVTKKDYATTKLSYTPEPGDTPAFDELSSVLYAPEELEKILWFMGALLTNNMSRIQKFLYLHGGKGTGKGTIINIFKMMFEDYHATIDLANLTGDSAFATSEVKEVPLLIDEDADLSDIKRDTNLLKLTAHEPIVVNAKYRTTYTVTFDGLLVTASNQRFKVRNIDSGITRRAVVASPSNRTVGLTKYNKLMELIKYEIPQIACKAINVFNTKGIAYYESFIDYEMIEATDHFYSFVREHATALGDLCTLKRASDLYKLYLDDMGYESRGHKRKVKNELKRYYNKFYEAKRTDGVTVKNVFEDFKWGVVFPEKAAFVDDIEKAVSEDELLREHAIGVQTSIFDLIAAGYPAQLTKEDGTPRHAWDNVKTILSDINTYDLHYVRVPLQHIVIDFDLKENGEKSLLKNLEAMSVFPPTYTELSKSGKGVHLHYIYDGDVTRLEDHYGTDIEVKVFTGKSSLRRKLTKCNDLPIAHISTGLPLKEEKVELYKDIEIIMLDEKRMISMINANLQRKYKEDTRSCVNFIVDIFKKAEAQGVQYDLESMRHDILVFASSSTNQAEACVRDVSKIKYRTIKNEDAHKFQQDTKIVPNERLYFFDVEVYPNLFVLVYKQYGYHEPVVLINPSAERVEAFLSLDKVGYNCRRYDNHIVYSAALGDDNFTLYRQSQRIINDKDASSGMYGAAYELSYTDIYDYANAGNKKSLKKWMVELGITHIEMDIPWDQPVPEHLWSKVASYCVNDVMATEAVFNATKADYNARKILCLLSGLSMNATTNQHTTRIVFEGVRDTKSELVYWDLSKEFPGYRFENGKSSYRGEDPGEGGYVYAEPGIYTNVPSYDGVSMHPHQIKKMNLFGRFTKNYVDLLDARIALKHGDFETAASMFGGKLKPFLGTKEDAKDLALALKTALNSAYGLTKAGFDNPFRHPQNVDNIVAKRGALFMIDLKHEIQDRGFQVIHIKTDSIKVVDPTPELTQFIYDFGLKYGLPFEVEETYDVIGLVNDAVYISKNKDGEWSATGAQFKQPYVFKTLFSKENVEPDDYMLISEVKKGAIYIGERFVGRFAETYASLSGEEMFVIDGEKKSSVSGKKGHLWKLSTEYAGKDDIDMSYYQHLSDGAIKSLESVGKENISKILL